MIDEKIHRNLALRIDKLTMAMLLLISSLRAKIKTEEGEAVAAIPVKVLDAIENMITNL